MVLEIKQINLLLGKEFSWWSHYPNVQGRILIFLSVAEEVITIPTFSV